MTAINPLNWALCRNSYMLGFGRDLNQYDLTASSVAWIPQYKVSFVVSESRLNLELRNMFHEL